MEIPYFSPDVNINSICMLIRWKTMNNKVYMPIYFI